MSHKTYLMDGAGYKVFPFMDLLARVETFSGYGLLGVCPVSRLRIHGSVTITVLEKVGVIKVSEYGSGYARTRMYELTERRRAALRRTWKNGERGWLCGGSPSFGWTFYREGWICSYQGC